MSFLRNRTVIGVFCILLSVLICFGLTPLFNRAVSQKVEIVRVTQPIRAGEQITDDMVQMVQVGGYNLPDNILHEKANAVGKYATADLAVGDYIINTKISDVPAADNAYLYDLDGSQQAKLGYMTDSKGFRQPVYSFTLSDENDVELRGGTGWTTFVPALAG